MAGYLSGAWGVEVWGREREGGREREREVFCLISVFVAGRSQEAFGCNKGNSKALVRKGKPWTPCVSLLRHELTRSLKW